MPYIGTSPSNGVRRKHTYTATASQTSFSGAGAEGATLSYNDSNFVDVYQNGVKLSEADYTSTSGTAIVLATGATVSDMIEIVVYDVFSVADTVSKSAGGTFDGAVTLAGGVSGVLDADDGITVDNITIDGTEIDLSSGNLTLDVAGNINLDADGGNINLQDGSVGSFGYLSNSSSDFVIQSGVDDKDIIFKGSDGGSTITALTLDMSAAGEATFNDNIVMGTANKGIHLGVTSATASNLLDDYEEGTFTPTLDNSANNLGAGYASRAGFYTKTGNSVHFVIHITLNAYTSSSNQVYVTGLPFTSKNVSNCDHYFLVSGGHLNVDSNYLYVAATLGPNTAQLTPLMIGDSVSRENFRSHDITATNAEFFITGNYLT